MGKIKAVIFDIDGTLLNSAEIVTRLWSGVFEKFGLFLKPDELKKHLGKSPAQLARELLPEKNPEEIDRCLQETFRREVPAFPIFEGVVGTIVFLEKRGIKIGAVSGGPLPNMKHYLSAAGILHHFSSLASAADFPEGKITGAPFLHVCRELGVEPAETVCIGDAPLDAVGARNAGCIALGVLGGGHGKEELELAGVETIEGVGNLPEYLKGAELL
ncbi:MAG: HAD family phosphatase [archaeon]